MTDYPNWVSKYKTKGTYLNVVKGKYYLYAAHSERVPGTNKVKRICDEYLGRITQEDGLIPPRDKIKPPILSYEYGLSTTILSVCSNIHKGLRKSFVKHGDFVMCASSLSFIYGTYSADLFRSSYLSICFPEVDFSMFPTDAQMFGIECGTLMILSAMTKAFGDDLPDIRNQFIQIQKLNINKKFYLPIESDTVIALKEKFHISWRD